VASTDDDNSEKNGVRPDAEFVRNAEIFMESLCSQRQVIHNYILLLASSNHLVLANSGYRKTLFFRRILISQFPYVQNSLHFNLADFPVNFIKQFVSCFFWCLKQMLLSKSSRIIVYTI